jgi:hypothetical protein
MTALLEKDAKFIWSEKCQANFEEEIDYNSSIDFARPE